MAWGDFLGSLQDLGYTRSRWSTRSTRDDDQRKTPTDLPEQVLALMQLLYAELREEAHERHEAAQLREARRRAACDDIELAS